MVSKRLCSAAVLLMLIRPSIEATAPFFPWGVVHAESSSSKTVARSSFTKQEHAIDILPLHVAGSPAADGSDRRRTTPAAVSKKRSKVPSASSSATARSRQTRWMLYTAEAGDTLKTISQKYYGSSLYFPVILLHNPNIQDFDVEEGAEIRILEDAVEAIHLFRQHTFVDEGRIFWLYTAQQNDSLEGIGRKFYRTRYGNNPLVNLNPESRIRPGEKIHILLN